MRFAGLDRRGVGVWPCVVPLTALSALFTVGLSLSAAHRLAGSEAGALRWGLEFRLALALWVRSDRLMSGSSLPFDFEAFVFFAWPFVLPYYLYRTRGRRALLYVVGVYVLYSAPYVTAAVTQVASRL